MASKALPSPILWFVIVTDVVIAALALGLYFGLLPKFHPALEHVPPPAYLLAALAFSAGAALMLLAQRRLPINRG